MIQWVIILHTNFKGLGVLVTNIVFGIYAACKLITLLRQDANLLFLETKFKSSFIVSLLPVVCYLSSMCLWVCVM